jgi:chorismate dehydratase
MQLFPFWEPNPTMRIGAVSYLNTKPLVYDLQRLAPDHELVLDIPSRLADELAAGRLDVALIPSVEFFGKKDYLIVSDACIACRGPVRSVQLLSRVPVANIRRLALDEGSRTSAVLVQVLLKRLWGVSAELSTLPMEAPPYSASSDALLVIGDRAMHPPPGLFVEQLDLGEVWCRWTGLPFVFAMWVARRTDASGERSIAREATLAALSRQLAAARDLGLAHVEQIAAAEHAAAGLSHAECVAYFREHLYFYLGPRERAGLERFYQEASALGLVPGGQALRLEEACGADLGGLPVAAASSQPVSDAVSVRP